MATAGSHAYKILRQLILDGKLAPGDRIREEEMCEVCGTSRTPVREALRRLSSEGWVLFEPNHGAQVATISGEDLEDIYRLRAMVEGYAAERAAERLTQSQLQRLKVLADVMEDAVRRKHEPINEIFTPANTEFHQILLKAAGSKRLPRIAATVVEMPLVLRALASYSFEERLRSAMQHHELIAAFEARDPSWAGATMRGHVLGAYWALIRSVKSVEDSDPDQLMEVDAGHEASAPPKRGTGRAGKGKARRGAAPPSRKLES
jgi:DNA-binding GntR family transcriptional regulator